jgi:subtilisin family serine protease
MKRAALSLVVALCSLSIVACSHHDEHPKVNPTPTPTATSTGAFDAAAFTCPSSDTTSTVARSGSNVFGEAVHRAPARTKSTAPTSSLLAVTYAASYASGSAHAQIAAREQSTGATFVREFSFAHTGQLLRVVRTTPASIETVAAALRALPGVKSVAQTGFRRSKLSVNAPLLTNDPYFEGFGPGAPLYESASEPGQWDKHAVRLEDAFAYSQSGNGSNKLNPNALGSSTIKIAIIDSGEDPTHPELKSKIAYQKCFITNPDNTQSSSDFGIAAAATNTDLGFAGSGGAASIYAYQVFPEPDDNCTNDSSTDPQCSSDTADIQSAIEDAITQNVNVINLSLGGDTCSSGGTDPDPIEGGAIADAIAANIVVVAAAGNDGTEGVSAPGCDSGVIAAGATGLADGSQNGTGKTTGSSTSPTEYLASYSNYGSPGNAVNSASAWGIVAPGGDPSGDMDEDDLHWIENIWTSTPYMANSSDTSFEGSCTPDLDATSTTDDCRTLIAGTSMSTPAVAGAAALILAVNSSYQSSSKMKALLCQTADDIGDTHEGCGRLDVYRAMAIAIGDTSPPSSQSSP